MLNETDLDAFGYDYWSSDYKTKVRMQNMTPMSMVKEFSQTLDQDPQPYLYAGLIAEEADEWRSEYLRDTKADQLKELADLVYVIYGFANAKGWDLDEAVRRVHVNNLGRCIQPCDRCNGEGIVDKFSTWEGTCEVCKGKGTTVQRRADGKILKNPNYPKVDLTDLV
jgi:NTP pyrophosphatase (non-canonical NTP hydrolase)